MSHAILSASGSERWLNCPASVAIESNLEEKKRGFAKAGTLAHALAEICLREGKEPLDYIDEPFYDDEGEELGVIDYETAEAVEKYLIYVYAIGKEVHIETKVDYSHLVPEGYGTSDAIIERMEKGENGKDINTLYVIDYKHGQGVEVDARWNTQGMLYALGALNSLDMFFRAPIERVVIAIIQPRINNFSEFTLSVDDLNKWANSIRPKAERAYDLYKEPKKIKPKDYGPSEKGCRFCKARGTCKALAELGYKTALEGFEDVTKEVKGEDFKKVTTLNNAELGKAYQDMSLFVTWYEDLKALVLEKLMNGETIPGFKPVAGRSARKWKLDDAETVKALRTAGLIKKDYEVIKLISPTQAEKILKKSKPEDFKKRYEKLSTHAIIKAEGAPTIAKESDRRDSIAPNSDDFEDVSASKANENPPPVDKFVEGVELPN